MKWVKRLLLGLLLLLLCLPYISSTWAMHRSPFLEAPAASSAPLPTKGEPEMPLYSVDDLVDAFELSLQQLFPDRYTLQFDDSRRLLTVAITIPDEEYLELRDQVEGHGNLLSWYSLAGNTVEAASQWQATFNGNGHSDVDVVLGLFRHREGYGDQLLANIVRGELTYDYFEDLAISLVSPTLTTPVENQGIESITYILNTSTKRFHIPSCRSVSEIRSDNKETFTGSREALLAMGYDPCGICHP